MDSQGWLVLMAGVLLALERQQQPPACQSSGLHCPFCTRCDSNPLAAKPDQRRSASSHLQFATGAFPVKSATRYD
jgi:hypothetical protein